MSEQPKCGNCRFYAGECRRHAPIAMDGYLAVPLWPRVPPGCWCGDHEPIKPLDTPPENGGNNE